MGALDKSFERAMSAVARANGKAGKTSKPGKLVVGFMGIRGTLNKPGGWPPTGWVRVSQTEKETGHLPDDKAIGTILERKGRFAGGVAIYPYPSRPDPNDQLWRGQEFATREAAEEHVRQLMDKIPPRTPKKKTAADRSFERALKRGYYIVDTWFDAVDQPTRASAISVAKKLVRENSYDWVRVNYSPGPDESESLGRAVFLIWTDQAGKRHETQDPAEIRLHPARPGE